MITAPKSGKKATLLRSVSTPGLVSNLKMTYTNSTTLKLSSSFDASKYFFLNSCKYPLTIRKNGVVSGGTITASGSNAVYISDFTCYIQGSLATVSGASVSSLAVPASGRKYYALIYSTSGITSVAGVSGPAATTFGSGGAPLVSSTSIVLGYIRRDSDDGATIASDEIILVDDNFGGREYSGKHLIKHIRPVVGRIDLHQALPLQHSGSQAALFYWTGYHFNGNEIKVAQLRDWSLGVTQNREDTSLQGSYAATSNGGQLSYSFSFNKLINQVSPALFSHMTDPESNADYFIKAYVDQADTTEYYSFQAGIDVDMSFPQDDTASAAGTGNITGFVEGIDENS